MNNIIKPWGWYVDLYRESNYKIKKIHVNPKSNLSLQSHKFRSEFWIVIEGDTDVQIGDDIHTLQKNQSIYIPKNVQHRIQNKSEIPVEIIEIQYGTKIDEDDIIRYSDDYGR